MARKLAGNADRERELSDADRGPDPKGETTRSPRLDRRSYVKLGGAVALSTLPTPASAGGSRTITRYGIEFDEVLDAVEDLGLDPTGSAPVDRAIRAAGDGALIQFPDGIYRFERDSKGVLFEGGRRGIEGIGDDVLFTSRATSGCRLAGTDLDGGYIDNVTVARTGQPGNPDVRLAGERLVVTNVSFRGGCVGTGHAPTLVVSTPSSRGGARLANISSDRHGDHPASTRTDTLRISGTGTPANYEFTVDGRIETDEMPATGHNLSGANSEGTVEGEPVSYLVDGEITDFRLDGPAAVDLNGEALDPEILGSRSPHVLAFDGREAATSYAFDVGGLRSGPSVGAGTAHGVSDSVSRGVDEYRFDGDIASLTARGTARLTIGSQ